MKRTILSAVTAAMFFAACSDKEDLVPRNQVQDKPIVSEVIQSNVITLEEARENLEIFLKDFSSLSKRSGDFSSRKISDGFTLKSDKRSISKSTEETPEAKIHVFNFENNGGFAIMSATRDMPELLAITEGGNIDTNEVIEDPGLALFLYKFGNMPIISSSDDEPAHQEKMDPGVTAHTEVFYTYGDYKNELFNPVGGYCKVHWGQEEPYNKYCPLEYGDTTKTGCVATACAQLMSVYQYPTSYNGYLFNWDNMINNRDNDAVARLMEQIGLPENTNMDYHLDISEAEATSIPRTFEHFGYKCGGVVKDYNKNEVVNEIKEGHCVPLGGLSYQITNYTFWGKKKYSYSGGHFWLAHGVLTRSRTVTKTTVTIYTGASRPEDSYEVKSYVEKNDYILCNFGWREQNFNGYYLGDVFDINIGPDFAENISKSGTAGNYQYKLTMVTGIRK